MIKQIILLIYLSIGHFTFSQVSNLPLFFITEDSLSYSLDTNRIIIANSCVPDENNLIKTYLHVSFKDNGTFEVIDSTFLRGMNCNDIKLDSLTLKSYPKTATREYKTKGLKIKTELKETSMNELSYQHEIITKVLYQKEIIAQYESTIKTYQKKWKKVLLNAVKVWKVDDNYRIIQVHLLESAMQVFTEHRIEYVRLRSY